MPGRKGPVFDLLMTTILFLGEPCLWFSRDTPERFCEVCDRCWVCQNTINIGYHVPLIKTGVLTSIEVCVLFACVWLYMYMYIYTGLHFPSTYVHVYTYITDTCTCTSWWSWFQMVHHARKFTCSKEATCIIIHVPGLLLEWSLGGDQWKTSVYQL